MAPSRKQWADVFREASEEMGKPAGPDARGKWILMEKYFKPKSLTWWGCVAFAVASGLAGAGVEVPTWVFGLIASVTGVGARGALSQK